MEVALDTALAGKTVAILAEFNVEDSEFLYTRMRLIEAGATVIVVGPHPAGMKYKGKHGVPFQSTHTIADVAAADIDGLIVPGGFAPDYWRRDERMKALVKDMDDAGKPIGTICHGPWLLISAKILRGRTCTCFCAINDDVENAGATLVQDQPVVVDRNLVTSRTPDDLPWFLRGFIAVMSA